MSSIPASVLRILLYAHEPPKGQIAQSLINVDDCDLDESNNVCPICREPLLWLPPVQAPGFQALLRRDLSYSKLEADECDHKETINHKLHENETSRIEPVVDPSTDDQEVVTTDLNIGKPVNGDSHNRQRDGKAQDNTQTNTTKILNRTLTNQTLPPNEPPNQYTPTPEPAVRLNCGHIFGKVCISSWLDTSPTCPNCRSVVLGPLNEALRSWRHRRASTLAHLGRERPQKSSKPTILSRRAIGFVRRETSDDEAPTELMQNVCIDLARDPWCLVNGRLERYIDGWATRRCAGLDCPEDEVVMHVVRVARWEMGECARAVGRVGRKGKGGKRRWVRWELVP